MKDNLDRKYKKDISLMNIFLCLINYNFKSFRRFLIYIFHNSGHIDLRRISSEHYTDEQIINILERWNVEKIRKNRLYSLTNQSKNTFNKNFKDYFEKHNLSKRRTFSLYETYQILSEWQGEGKWGRLNAIKKQTLSEILNAGDYKKTAEEFHIFMNEESYKGKDKFSPKEIKEFINHIDLNEKHIEEKLMGYDDFKIISLFIFIGMIVSQVARKDTAMLKH